MSEPRTLALGFAVAALSALGYGLLVAKFTRSEDRPQNSNLAADGVVGIAILTTLFIAAHFFVPLRQTLSLIILAPGVIAFAFFFKRRFLIELPILAVMIWWAYQVSRSYPVSWDHGLYHLQSAMWNTLEPVIAGLANVQTRLGFDSSVFVLAAGFNIPLFGGWHFTLLSPVIIEAMIMTDLLLSIRSSPEKTARLYCLIAVVFLLFAPKWLLQPTYISPDQVVAIGIVYVILLFLEKRSVTLLLCVPYLITVKLAVLPLLLLLDWKNALKKYRVATIIGGAFLFLWVTRNIVLSGHLLFPVAATGLPLPWAVPRDLTQETADWITSWARWPGKSLEETRGMGWIRPWLYRTYEDQRVITAVELFCTGIFLLIWKKALRQVDWRLVLALALALLFWFISAPDPRFGIGFMCAAGFLMLAYGLDSTGLLRLEAGNASIVIVVLILGLSRTALLENISDWPKMMPPNIRVAITATGERIWAPVSPDNKCFALVPCAPEPDKIRYYPARALQRAPIP